MPGAEAHPERTSWIDAWHVDPSIKRNYDFIDGLRGIALILVLCCHHLYVNPKSGPSILFAGSLFGAMGSGVYLFFGISGFLISWPLWKKKFSGANRAVPSGYAQRRFWKIYPPLALSVVLLTPVYIAFGRDWSYLSLAGKWLVGLPFIVPVSGKLNPVMWTLVVEVQFYVTLPVVFFSLRKIPANVCLWLIPLLFFLVPTVYRTWTGTSATFAPNIDSHYPSALDSFCFGILLAGLDGQGLLPKWCANLGSLGIVMWPVALLLYAWALWPAAPPRPIAESAALWMVKIGSAALLCYVANPQSLPARILCAPALRWVGIISYEWYLFHQPIVSRLREILGPAGGSVGRYLATIVSSLLFSGCLSACVYRYFSLPILKYGRTRATTPHRNVS